MNGSAVSLICSRDALHIDESRVGCDWHINSESNMVKQNKSFEKRKLKEVLIPKTHHIIMTYCTHMTCIMYCWCCLTFSTWHDQIHASLENALTVLESCHHNQKAHSFHLPILGRGYPWRTPSLSSLCIWLPWRGTTTPRHLHWHQPPPGMPHQKAWKRWVSEGSVCYLFQQQLSQDTGYLYIYIYSFGTAVSQQGLGFFLTMISFKIFNGSIERTVHKTSQNYGEQK